MNRNCARRMSERELAPWASRASDFAPEVGSHRKVVKVLLTFKLPRWKWLNTQQVKDSA